MLYRYVNSLGFNAPNGNMYAVDVPSIVLEETKEQAEKQAGFFYRFVLSPVPDSPEMEPVLVAYTHSTISGDEEGMQETLSDRVFTLTEDEFIELGGKIYPIIQEGMLEVLDIEAAYICGDEIKIPWKELCAGMKPIKIPWKELCAGMKPIKIPWKELCAGMKPEKLYYLDDEAYMVEPVPEGSKEYRASMRLLHEKLADAHPRSAFEVIND